jgi:hypothetical protein
MQLLRWRSILRLALTALMVLLLSAPLTITDSLAAPTPPPTPPATASPQARENEPFHGPLTTAFPPVKPAGPAPPGVNLDAWQRLQSRWGMDIWRQVYFSAYPNLINTNVVIHHAIEKNVLNKNSPYYGLFTEAEIHGLANLRAIPGGPINNRVHLSRIRRVWDEFYRQYPNKPLTAPEKQALKAEFVRKKELIDTTFGWMFLDQASSYSAEQAAQRRASIDNLARAAFTDAPYNFWPAFDQPAEQRQDPQSFSGAVQALGGSSASGPGGIDFASLELRYVSTEPSGSSNHIGYAFSARPTSDGHSQGIMQGITSIEEASDAFFVWLSLPTSSFTVNLNPAEPYNIIDAAFGTTDAGRILLEADLQMKKTVAQMIHPDSELGRRFWNALHGSCFSLRQWIVPAPATVRETSDGLYIVDAPLDVKMESEYLQLPEGDIERPTCPQQPSDVDAYNEHMFRTMVLPEVKKAVNEGSEYAALRRVYHSRVAAQWYRERALNQPMTYAKLIDSKNVDRWPARQPWDPMEVFNRYVQSLTSGEFNVTRTHQNGQVAETRAYVYGGVDFSDVPRETASDSELQVRWPDTINEVKSSFTDVVAGQSGELWFGADYRPEDLANMSAADSVEGFNERPSPYSLTLQLGAALGALLLVGGGVHLSRNRRIGRR